MYLFRVESMDKWVCCKLNKNQKKMKLLSFSLSHSVFKIFFLRYLIEGQ
jgi:hypothetical protein